MAEVQDEKMCLHPQAMERLGKMEPMSSEAVAGYFHSIMEDLPQIPGAAHVEVRIGWLSDEEMSENGSHAIPELIFRVRFPD